MSFSIKATLGLNLFRIVAVTLLFVGVCTLFTNANAQTIRGTYIVDVKQDIKINSDGSGIYTNEVRQAKSFQQSDGKVVSMPNCPFDPLPNYPISWKAKSEQKLVGNICIDKTTFTFNDFKTLNDQSLKSIKGSRTGTNFTLDIVRNDPTPTSYPGLKQSINYTYVITAPTILSDNSPIKGTLTSNKIEWIFKAKYSHSVSIKGSLGGGQNSTTKVNLTGIWRGKITHEESENPSVSDITLTLRQTGQTVTGTSFIEFEGDFVEFTLTGRFDGETLEAKEGKVIRKSRDGWCMNRSMSLALTQEKTLMMRGRWSSPTSRCVGGEIQVTKEQPQAKSTTKSKVVGKDIETYKFKLKSGEILYTKIPLYEGDNIEITADGEIQIGWLAGKATANGVGGYYDDKYYADAPHASVILATDGFLGSYNWAFCGAYCDGVSKGKGEIILAINDTKFDDNFGSFSIKVVIRRKNK